MPQIQVLPSLGPTRKEKLGAGIAQGFANYSQTLHRQDQVRYQQDYRDQVQLNHITRMLERSQGDPALQKNLMDTFRLTSPHLIDKISFPQPIGMPPDAAKKINQARDDIKKEDEGDRELLTREFLRRFLPQYPGYLDEIETKLGDNFSTMAFSRTEANSSGREGPTKFPFRELLNEELTRFKGQGQRIPTGGESSLRSGAATARRDPPQGQSQVPGVPPILGQGQALGAQPQGGPTAPGSPPVPSGPVVPGGPPQGNQPFRVEQGLIDAFSQFNSDEAALESAGATTQQGRGAGRRTREQIQDAFRGQQGFEGLDKAREQRRAIETAKRVRSEAGVPKQHLKWTAYLDVFRPEIAAMLDSWIADGAKWDKIHAALREKGIFEGTNF